MNALNFALEHAKVDTAKYLIGIGDDDLLLNEYLVAKENTSRTALHQIILNKVFPDFVRTDLARALLEKVVNKRQALISETKYGAYSKRERTFPCLHLAAILGNGDLVRLFTETGLRHGLTVNQRNSKKDTALHWASRSGESDIAQFLINKGASPNAVNDKLTNALHWAVQFGHTEVMDVLLKNSKMNINGERMTKLSTSLMIACASGSSKSVQLLIEKRANINLSLEDGSCALHVAVENRHLDVVTMLLDNGADVSKQNYYGEDAINIASKKGFHEIVMVLLEFQADPFRKNKMGRNCWHFAFSQDDNNVLNVLLEYFSHNQVQNASQFLILHAAASVGNSAKLTYILDNGVAANTRDSDGNTFMHVAADYDMACIINDFHKICDINIQNKKGETPLHRAVILANNKSIRALLYNRARADFKDRKGQTALHLASKTHEMQPSIICYLLEYMINVHSWNSVRDVDRKGNNALHVAAKHASPHVIWELRKISLVAKNNKGCTPLHRAVHVVKWIPENLSKILDVFETSDLKFNINERNNTGKTVLHLAVLTHYSDEVKRIIHLGGDLAAKDENGDTPLHCLVKSTMNMNDPILRKRSLKTLDVIIQECPRWFCCSSIFKHEETDYFTKDQMLLQSYRRKGLNWLIHNVVNADQLSVLTLCFSVGAHEILSTILNLKYVKHNSDSQYFYDDITDIFPNTTSSMEKYHCRVFSKDERSKRCGIEMLSYVKDETRVVKILDIAPIQYMERKYNALTTLMFLMVLLWHIFFMTILCFAGLTPKPVQASLFHYNPSYPLPLWMYPIILVEPFALTWFSIKFSLYHLRQHRDQTKNSFIPYYNMHICFSFMIYLWLVLLHWESDVQGYVLGICLFVGWFYIVFFLYMWSGLHLFWRMLKYLLLKDIFLFFVIYFILLIAFSSAYAAIFWKDIEHRSEYDTFQLFQDVIQSGFVVLNLMWGLEDLFYDVVNKESTTFVDKLIISKIFFTICFIFSTIILMNMLIARMNDTYNKVSKKQKILRRIDTILIGEQIVRFFPFQCLLKWWFSEIIVSTKKENEHSAFKYTLRRYKHTPQTHWFKDIFHTKKKKKKHAQLDIIQEQVLSLNLKIDDLTTKLDRIMRHQERKET
ncbi:hypothetical protein FSP39_025504 [Pinctada imbricata]|uniref:Ion transport domain-containing protein n=1 Tax=Pinctada imbricata TaxID=66713 RepID=A0AA88XE22_PINIB|nr:hypothetical protein FSP39_025504 [Pinctada imbricata]